jgi:hypothetical protein
MRLLRPCILYTSRIDYKPLGDQYKLDITVKSSKGIGELLKPTWNMVMSSKNGSISWESYISQYKTLIRDRYNNNRQGFIELLNRDNIVLCCYCADTSHTTKHCHRYLAVEMLTSIASDNYVQCEYKGELSNVKIDKSQSNKPVKLGILDVTN